MRRNAASICASRWATEHTGPASQGQPRCRQPVPTRVRHPGAIPCTVPVRSPRCHSRCRHPGAIHKAVTPTQDPGPSSRSASGRQAVSVMSCLSRLCGMLCLAGPQLLDPRGQARVALREPRVGSCAGAPATVLATQAGDRAAGGAPGTPSGRQGCCDWTGSDARPSWVGTARPGAACRPVAACGWPCAGCRRCRR